VTDRERATGRTAGRRRVGHIGSVSGEPAENAGERSGPVPLLVRVDDLPCQKASRGTHPVPVRVVYAPTILALCRPRACDRSADRQSNN
jgi:hypothetical protein